MLDRATRARRLDQVSFREATPDDAAGMIAYMHGMLAEPGINLIVQPDEFTMTAEQERIYLVGVAATANETFMLAFAGEQIIGSVGIHGGKRRAIRHVARIGITVERTWRDVGVGTALMQRAITWARRTGIITRLELEVFAGNARAIHVYEQCGFRREGYRPRAIFRDGQYYDLIEMGLLFEE